MEQDLSSNNVKTPGNNLRTKSTTNVADFKNNLASSSILKSSSSNNSSILKRSSSNELTRTQSVLLTPYMFSFRVFFLSGLYLFFQTLMSWLMSNRTIGNLHSGTFDQSNTSEMAVIWNQLTSSILIPLGILAFRGRFISQFQYLQHIFRSCSTAFFGSMILMATVHLANRRWTGLVYFDISISFICFALTLPQMKIFSSSIIQFSISESPKEDLVSPWARFLLLVISLIFCIYGLTSFFFPSFFAIRTTYHYVTAAWTYDPKAAIDCAQWIGVLTPSLIYLCIVALTADYSNPQDRNFIEILHETFMQTFTIAFLVFILNFFSWAPHFSFIYAISNLALLALHYFAHNNYSVI